MPATETLEVKMKKNKIPHCSYCNVNQAVCRLQRTDTSKLSPELEALPACDNCTSVLLKLQDSPYKRIPIEHS